MKDDIKELLEDCKTIVDNTITFEKLLGVFNYVGMFIDDSLSSAFGDFMNEHCEETEEAELVDEVYSMYETLRGVDMKTVYTQAEFEGGEGEGDSWSHVIEHVNSGRFMLCEGWYASYEGFNTEDAQYTEVKAVPITVMDYQPI